MIRMRYPEEFKIEAVKQVMDRGHPVNEVAFRLGVSNNSLYQWIKRYRRDNRALHRADAQIVPPSLLNENRRLKEELKRVTEERDMLRKANAYFVKAQPVVTVR